MPLLMPSLLTLFAMPLLRAAFHASMPLVYAELRCCFYFSRFYYYCHFFDFDADTLLSFTLRFSPYAFIFHFRRHYAMIFDFDTPPMSLRQLRCHYSSFIAECCDAFDFAMACHAFSLYVTLMLITAACLLRCYADFRVYFADTL